jgi:tetratricopeptide (TPR) repeat protein
MTRLFLLAWLWSPAGRSIAADSPDLSALRQQAEGESAKGRFEKASELYARAAALDPADPELRRQLLQALGEAKRLETKSSLEQQAAAEVRNGRVSQAADLYAGAAAQASGDLDLLKDWMWTLGCGRFGPPSATRKRPKSRPRSWLWTRATRKP